MIDFFFLVSRSLGISASEMNADAGQANCDQIKSGRKFLLLPQPAAAKHDFCTSTHDQGWLPAVCWSKQGKL